MERGDLVLYGNELAIVLDKKEDKFKIGKFTPINWFYNEYGTFLPLQVIDNVRYNLLSEVTIMYR